MLKFFSVFQIFYMHIQEGEFDWHFNLDCLTLVRVSMRVKL